MYIGSHNCTQAAWGIKDHQDFILTRNFELGVVFKVDRVETVDSRIPAVDSRMPTVDSRIPAVDSRMPAVDSRMPTVDSRIPTVDSRISTVSCGKMVFELSFELPKKGYGPLDEAFTMSFHR